jgi:hypothetical protein
MLLLFGAGAGALAGNKSGKILQSVKQKIDTWLPSNMPNNNFYGTAADWEAYRQNWINNCAAMNGSGLLQNKNNALGRCQAAFDEHTKTSQNNIYAGNKEDLDRKEEQVAALINNIIYIALGIGFLYLVYWLLTS